MGGGEGSTAREALRHRSVEEVVMCDIDEVSLPSKHVPFRCISFFFFVFEVRKGGSSVFQ